MKPALLHDDNTAPRLPRRLRRTALWALAVLAALYVAWAAVLYFAQDAMIFPGTHRPRVSETGPPVGVDQVWFVASDGSRIEAWYQPGAGCAPTTPGPALLYFHGNYDLVDTAWWIAGRSVPAGLSTLVMEYRGYGRATGAPSQTALVEDALRCHDWLVARPEVDRRRIVFQGTSLGGGVAAALAAHRPPAALVLECTFTSLRPMAHGYGVPGFLCRHPFDTDRVLPTLSCPIAIYHGWRDRTIPVWHGRRLHELAPGSLYRELDCGHNDFRHDWDDVRTFLATAGVLP